MILDNLGSKMQSPSPGSWLQSLLMFDREAAVNLIEYTYGLEDLKVKSWETFKRSMGFNFGKYILPRFQEVSQLSPHDIGQIMNSTSSGIAQFFRSCQAFSLGSERERKLDKKPETCYTASHVRYFIYHFFIINIIVESRC